MKNRTRLKPMIAALLACSGLGAAEAAAVSSEADMRSEVRTIVIDGDVSIAGADGNPAVVFAQSEPGSYRREVKVITGGKHVSLPDLPEIPDVNVLISNAMSEAFAGVNAMPMARSVKNAPYSAEVISEKIQTLPDGNQITRKTSSLAYRDGAGRTRQETRDSKGDVKSVQIHDAVEGTRYILSPSKKSATKLGVDKGLQKRIEEIKEKARAMAKEGKSHVIEHSGPGEDIVVKRVVVPGADGKQEVREEVKVNVVRAAGAAGAHAGAYTYRLDGGESVGRALGELTRIGPIGASFQDMKWSGKSTTTQLGSRDFDGVRADGKSVSYTIPAGEIGNKNPITVTTETWYSPELQVTVYSKHSDPRSGDSIYRLANIKRSEPASTLFMVPDGYAVKEMPAIGVRTQK